MRRIQTIAVIGAGPTGRRVAHATALAGYRTILEDILPASLRSAEGEIRDSLKSAVELGKVNKAEAEAAVARLEFATSLEEAAREADMVIEAVPDEFESKEEIFRLLDRICRPETLLVATTAWLQVSDIAAITERPQDIVGMRLRQVQLGVSSNEEPAGSVSSDLSAEIEVVAAARSSEASLQAALEIGKKITSRMTVVREGAGSAI